MWIDEEISWELQDILRYPERWLGELQFAMSNITKFTVQLHPDR
jgi:hypothetical protein